MRTVSVLLIFVISLMAKPPSQNRALNSISPSNNAEKKGTLQNSLDSWLKDDWEPTQKETKKESLHVKEDDNSSFKLQNYVDKWKRYSEKKASKPKKPSHVEMINSLPVIGR